MSGPGYAPARPALDLPTPPLLTAAERAAAQHWALSLSPITDQAARQVALATAPAQLNRRLGTRSPCGWTHSEPLAKGILTVRRTRLDYPEARVCQ